MCGVLKSACLDALYAYIFVHTFQLIFRIHIVFARTDWEFVRLYMSIIKINVCIESSCMCCV